MVVASLSRFAFADHESLDVTPTGFGMSIFAAVRDAAVAAPAEIGLHGALGRAVRLGRHDALGACERRLGQPKKAAATREREDSSGSKASGRGRTTRTDFGAARWLSDGSIDLSNRRRGRRFGCRHHTGTVCSTALTPWLKS